MNADVCIWGSVGDVYTLRGKASTTALKQRRWIDLRDADMAESINWVIVEQINAGKQLPQVYVYSEAMYMPLGTLVKIGKNMAGGGTMFYYMIISDEPIESQDQAEAIVWESLGGANDKEPKSTDGTGDTGPVDGQATDAPSEQGAGRD